MTEDTDGVVGTIAPTEEAAPASPYHPEDESAAIVAADGQIEQFPGAAQIPILQSGCGLMHVGQVKVNFRVLAFAIDAKGGDG